MIYIHNKTGEHLFKHSEENNNKPPSLSNEALRFI